MTLPSPTRMRAALVLAGVVLLGSVTACTSGAHDAGTSAEPFSIQTSFSDLPAPSGEETPAALLASRPAKGQVSAVEGPFSSRYTLHDLKFTGSAVTGTLEVTSDVSDVIDLQVMAAFHDANGTVLGTAVFEKRGEGHADTGASPHAPEEKISFTIAVPAALKGKAVSASLAVPSLVNE